jgi:hypothetical protein
MVQCIKIKEREANNMNILLGLLLLFVICSGVLKLVFGILGLAFKLVFGVIGVVFGLLGFLLGGGIIAALAFALIGGLVCIPISMFAKR